MSEYGSVPVNIHLFAYAGVLIVCVWGAKHVHELRVSRYCPLTHFYLVTFFSCHG